MTTPTPASRSAAPSTSPAKPGSIPTASVQPLLAAHGGASMAASYLSKGNLCAARRQLVRALESVNAAIDQRGAA